MAIDIKEVKRLKDLTGVGLTDAKAALEDAGGDFDKALKAMLLIIAIISLTLAIMNILPIPALDGGRLWIMLVSRGLKRPISAKREEAINAAGFVVLLGLIVLITIVDVQRFF